jgi:hypothetical protein
MSGSSVGSSSEENSPVSYTIAENTGGKIKELDETMEKLDIGETVDQSYPSQKDFITRSGGGSGNIHQLRVIITEAAEDNDHAYNVATHVQVKKSRSNSKKEMRKFTFPPESGESSCRPSTTAQRYPPLREGKS